jgi:hypothetical protein
MNSPSAAAVEADTGFARAFARRGAAGGGSRLWFRPRPPEIVCFGFRTRPQVATQADLLVRSARARAARLVCRQDDLILYEGATPTSGMVGITPLTMQTMHLRLELEAFHDSAPHGSVAVETIVEPLPRGPEIEHIELPEKAGLGDPIKFAWRAPGADRCWIACPDGPNERPAPVVGEIAMRLDQPGRHTFRVIAQGRFGRTIVSRAVDVAAPTPRVAVPSGFTRAGTPGEEVHFDWDIDGAREAWLILPDGSAPRPVACNQALFVTVGTRSESFRLVAHGHDGSKRSVVLTVVPRLFASLE